MMRNRNAKLSAIHYKAWNDNSSLCGIQLEFMNGVKSDMFETEMAKQEGFAIKTIPIDVTKSIQSISLKI